MLYKLLVEMVVVGVSMVLVSLLISIAQQENVFQKPHFWPMVQGVFTTGAITHLFFELAGINQWYAKQYKRLI